MNMLYVAGMVLLVGSSSWAARPILAETSFLRALKIPIIAEEPSSQVAYAKVTEEMEETLSHHSHLFGKCAGFEVLPELQINSSEQIFNTLKKLQVKNEIYDRAPIRALQVTANPQIEAALQQVSEQNLRANVEWLSSFPTRSSRAANPNDPVDAMVVRLQQMTALAGYPVTIKQIDHRGTKQKSIQLTLQGKDRPNEILVFGAHFDSINNQWGGGNAPGVDDNASGSSNLLETLRIILNQPQPQRTLEFYWYAAEESGLIGSAEIAAKYKEMQKDVVAVLQLDMTLYPGIAPFTLGSMTDFTSAWMRDYLRALNDVYIKATIVEDKCGYGCSDHASWYRQSYPTLMPFEATFRTMNPNIHSTQDLITANLNFAHSAMFTKIALVMAMDLGNSLARQPY